MHEIFLAEKISDAVIKFCGEQDIGLLEDLLVAVDKDCRVSPEQLITLIRDKKPMLVDADTRIRFVYDMPSHMAEIRSVCGSAGLNP